MCTTALLLTVMAAKSQDFGQISNNNHKARDSDRSVQYI